MKFVSGIVTTVVAISAFGYALKAANFPIAEAKEIPWGWYERADSQASGTGITSWNMHIGETGVRCMCGGDGGTEEHTGFFVQDQGDGTFIVSRAPKGYSDTPGRRFRWKRAINNGVLAD